MCRLREYIEKEDHTITIMDYFPNIGTLEKTDIPPEFRDKVEEQKHQRLFHSHFSLFKS